MEREKKDEKVFQEIISVDLCKLRSYISNWDQRVEELTQLFTSDSGQFYLKITELIYDVYSRRIMVIKVFDREDDNSNIKYVWWLLYKVDIFYFVSRERVSVFIMRIALYFCSYYMGFYQELIDKGEKDESIVKRKSIFLDMYVQFQGWSQKNYSTYKVMEIYEQKYSTTEPM